MEKNEDIEAIFLLGDTCKHHLAVEEGDANNNWQIMKQTMQIVISEIVTAFPNIPIIPVIGNNDVVYHA